ncbi:MAG: UDP-N-acetylmuramoyl-L-alanine--D-glutamate ligase [Oscillospiraceae bacterium]|nr:UDP-N-acetylmuramoyl-L-alanine--D-glutamate ligase [Oscillospiraceae bacterium]
MNLKDYLGSLQRKTVAVIGIGVSNTPLIRLLREDGIAVTACDKKSREELGELAVELENMGAKLRLGEGYLRDLREDVIFRTPGMRPDVPELCAAIERGSVLTSEMEVFFEVCPCPILAVTGSDGKTTTTTLVSELLKAEGKTVHVGGNIGHPLLAEAGEMKADDFAVLELSSFQLMTMCKSADKAIVTNLSPNHLDVHKDYREYVEAKENIFLHQSADGLLILNADNADDVALAPKAKGKVLWFSRRKTVENGAYLKDGVICFAENGASREVLAVSDIRIPGTHNIENYMAAIAMVQGLVSDGTIRAVAKSFNGVAHRIELVRTLRGVRYYNDSIASSPSRTIAGLRAFPEKVILIAGGKDKGIPYDEIGPEIRTHVKELFLTGMTAEKIRRAVVDSPDYDAEMLPIHEYEDFRETILAASAAAKDGDVVILSPASTSFDKFRNFAHRGDTFRAIVEELK